MKARNSCRVQIGTLGESTLNVKETASEIAREIEGGLERIDDREADNLVEAIIDSDKIFCHSLGREGVIMRAFAMRLMHLGLKSFVVGDMITPPIGKGDLLIVSVGPGVCHTIAALMEVAKKKNGRIAVITAHPESELARMSDIVIDIPGSTMAKDKAPEHRSIQPMGSLQEQMLLVYLDAITMKLMEKLNETAEDMVKRHTNLE